MIYYIAREQNYKRKKEKNYYIKYKIERLAFIYTLLSTPVVSAATSARPFCRESFGIFAV